MIPIGIFAKTFPRPRVYEVFTSVVEHQFGLAHFNFACAGLASMPAHIPESVLDEIQAAKAAVDLECAGVSATFNMAHPDIVIRRDGLQKLEVIAAACASIDTPLISLCTGSRDPHDKWRFHPDNHSQEAWSDMATTMEAAIQIAEDYDLQLGIEPELANVVNSVSKAQQLIAEMGSSRLRVILDPANLFERAESETIKQLIDDAIDRLGPSISMTHAKDRDASGEFVPPGQGVIPFDFFVERLEQAGIACPLIAHGFGESEAMAVGRYLWQIGSG